MGLSAPPGSGFGDPRRAFAPLLRFRFALPAASIGIGVLVFAVWVAPISCSITGITGSLKTP